MSRTLKGAPLLWTVAMLSACAAATLPPTLPPPTPPPVSVGVGITLKDRALAGVHITAGPIGCDTDGRGIAYCVPVPVTVTALQIQTPEGYLPVDDVPLELVAGQNAEVVVTLVPIVPPVPPLARVSTSGTRFVRDGQPFDWQGATAFQLVQLVATGRQAEADAFIAALTAKHITVFRILTTAQWMFKLGPAEGRAALAETLALLHTHQAYAEVVALADTCGVDPGSNPCPQSAPYFDVGAHVRALAATCVDEPVCLSIQIANEPDNRTQARDVNSVGFLCNLANQVPRPVLVTLGPGNEADDGVNAYITQCPRADYSTAHGDRADGDDGWRWVRHTREMQTVRDATGKPMVNDEPNRVGDVDRNFGVALICRLYGLGDTVHLAALRFAQIPGPDEMPALEARARAWALFPPGFSGRYSRATLSGDPVVGINDELVLRSYSGLQGNVGYVALVGVKPGGEASIVWGNGWAHERLGNEGGAVLFRVTR